MSDYQIRDDSYEMYGLKLIQVQETLCKGLVWRVLRSNCEGCIRNDRTNSTCPSYKETTTMVTHLKKRISHH